MSPALSLLAELICFSNPTAASAMPKRRKPVYGKSLLWQPEVAFVYLAVTEQYPDCIDAVEAAAGAVQNLTACDWKVREGRGGEGRGGDRGGEGRISYLPHAVVCVYS